LRSYQTKANPESNLQRDLINHTAVVKGCAFVNDAVNYLNNQSIPIPLVLGEVGSTLGNASNNSALENVLGSALWQADLLLYSMSIGVKIIHWQSGLTFPFALWNPEYTIQNKTIPASVHAPFYGQIYAAAFRGSTEKVSVHNVELNNPFLSAYAAYDNGKLGRVALLNLELWSEDENRGRSTQNIRLVLGDDVSSVVTQRLTSPQGGIAGVDNITWSGMQWTAANNGRGSRVRNDSTTLSVEAGRVEIQVAASEAVRVYLKH
jgi:hypothetical protein